MLKNFNDGFKRFLFLEDDNYRRDIKEMRQQEIRREEARCNSYYLH